MKVRIIPMSLYDETFKGKNIESIQKDFFNDYLINISKGWYYYGKNGLEAEEGDLITDPTWSAVEAIKNKNIFIVPTANDSWDMPGISCIIGIKEDGEIVKANMVNELVKVPNTNSNRSYYLYAFVGLLTISGIGMIIYDKKRKK